MRMRFCLLLALVLGWAPSLPADILYSVVNLGTLGGITPVALQSTTPER